LLSAASADPQIASARSLPVGSAVAAAPGSAGTAAVAAGAGAGAVLGTVAAWGRIGDQPGASGSWGQRCLPRGDVVEGLMKGTR